MFLGVFFFAAGLVVLGTTPAPMRRDVTADVVAGGDQSQEGLGPQAAGEAPPEAETLDSRRRLATSSRRRS